MEPTPDTGGGLSGFIAMLLLQVYRHFPFAGTWDWLLLYFALALLGVALFWPYLWKAVSSDMRILEQQEIGSSIQEAVLLGWGQLWQWLLIMFFYSDAGRAMLEGRHWFGSGSLSEVSRTLFWITLGVDVVLEIVMLALVGVAAEQTDMLATGTPKPFSERTIANLFCGGGTFYFLQEDGSTEVSGTGVMIALFPMVGFLALIFYWYWSAASILLMHTMSLAIIFNEVVRMTFVYIQHRRTFG